MGKGKKSENLFDILEDDRIIFTVSRSSKRYDPRLSPNLILAQVIRNESDYKEASPHNYSKSQKPSVNGSEYKPRIEIYLDNILKSRRQAIGVPINDGDNSDLDDWLEQSTVDEINDSTLHELIHREGSILHNENYVKTPKNLEKANKILDYFIYVNTHRDQIIGRKPGKSPYIFFWRDFSFLSKKAAYKIDLEKQKLMKAIEKLKPSDYDPSLSDDIVKDENFEALMWGGYYSSIKNSKDEAIECITKQFKIGYMPGFGQDAFDRFLKKALY